MFKSGPGKLYSRVSFTDARLFCFYIHHQIFLCGLNIRLDHRQFILFQGIAKALYIFDYCQFTRLRPSIIHTALRLLLLVIYPRFFLPYSSQEFAGGYYFIFGPSTIHTVLGYCQSPVILDYCQFRLF